MERVTSVLEPEERATLIYLLKKLGREAAWLSRFPLESCGGLVTRRKQ